jgi:hypothetical protein
MEFLDVMFYQYCGQNLGAPFGNGAVELHSSGVIAPFPNLTALDVGTHKGFSPTVHHA